MTKYPRHSSDLVDLKAAASEFVLPGFVTERPILKKSDRIWTIGSCFAQNIADALKAIGVPCTTAELEEGLNSPPLLRHYLSSVETGTSGYVSEQEIRDMRTIITEARAAILTFGLAVAVLDASGKIAFGTSGTFHPISAREATSDIRGAVHSLRRINPQINIFLTLSPVPINRSFWSPSAVAADCVSKSTLRVAIEEFLREKMPNVYYWPAFEIVRWLGAHRPNHYGADDGLQRHVSKDVVKVATELFVKSFIEA
jgi:hypothetical protein